MPTRLANPEEVDSEDCYPGIGLDRIKRITAFAEAHGGYDEEVERRRRALEQADANNRIEGIKRPPETDYLFESFVLCDIDLADILPLLNPGQRDTANEDPD